MTFAIPGPDYYLTHLVSSGVISYLRLKRVHHKIQGTTKGGSDHCNRGRRGQLREQV